MRNVTRRMLVGICVRRGCSSPSPLRLPLLTRFGRFGAGPGSDIRDCCGRCYMWIVDFAGRRSRPRSRTVLVRIYARPYLVPHHPTSEHLPCLYYYVFASSPPVYTGNYGSEFYIHAISSRSTIIRTAFRASFGRNLDTSSRMAAARPPARHLSRLFSTFHQHAHAD